MRAIIIYEDNVIVGANAKAIKKDPSLLNKIFNASRNNYFHICNWCGSEFKGIKNGKYCTVYCSIKYRGKHQHPHNPVLNSRMLTYKGETLPIYVWAKKMNINLATLRNRIWSEWPEERLFSPVENRYIRKSKRV